MASKENERLYELKRKSPGIAGFLNLVFVGLGYFYIKQFAAGFAALFIVVLVWAILGPLGIIANFVTVITGFKAAEKQNNILAAELGLPEEK